ncbi:uncharacterized protein EDB91DRAFT_814350 [Suillus paluster]|uniref:uncharacterized protein n=1 Tax=Suillus paluster TaxID=48578 RepID=UPI001B87D1FA|nr:uncharacterized protein EDB91DRAFT_814350 [Suillus paluster]KAG1729334.1 hypothetical protein EDB91DRAFT_814350 [Suillus paluster]
MNLSQSAKNSRNSRYPRSLAQSHVSFAPPPPRGPIMNRTPDPPVHILRGVAARPRIHRLSCHTTYPSGATDFGTCVILILITPNIMLISIQHMSADMQWCVRHMFCQDRVPTEVVTDPASLELGTGGSPVTYTMLADMQWYVWHMFSKG